MPTNNTHEQVRLAVALRPAGGARLCQGAWETAFQADHEAVKGKRPLQLLIDRKYLFNLGEEKQCVVVGLDGAARLVPR